MEALKKKQTQILNALQTLDVAINNYTHALKLSIDPSVKTTERYNFFSTQEEFIRTIRDSMIKRFEFCSDNIWKFLKDYLENVEKITLDLKSPRATFRALAQARLINEQEADTAIEMVDSRNKTTHIYKEEIADLIAKNIIQYNKLMIMIMQRIKI